MSGRLALCSVLSLVACDRAFSLDRPPEPDAPFDADIDASIDAPVSDLDGDGVPDNVDPCIHAADDTIGDLDSDGVFDSGDTCPYDGPNGADPDGDGLGIACDPFSTPGDRSRCLMRFSNPTINAALWPGRPGAVAWTNAPLRLIGDPPVLGQTIATTIVATSIEGETVTSYDVASTVNSRGEFGSFTVWIRADPSAPSVSDIGCRWVNEPSLGPRIAVVNGVTLLDVKSFPSPPTSAMNARVNARVVTTAGVGAPARVTCKFSFGSSSAISEASPPLPMGRFGLSVDRWLIEVFALHVLDRTP